MRARLIVELVPSAEVAAQAGELVVREAACCAFFTFGLVATGGALRRLVSVQVAALAEIAGA